MEAIFKKSLLEFLNDLTDKQISRLVYYCLECNLEEIARHRKVSKQAINVSLMTIRRKRKQQEVITALQEILTRDGFML